MTAASNHKRLNAVEVALSPKQWAIRVADDQRRHSSAIAWIQAAVTVAPEDTPAIRGWDALARQVEDRYPGNKPGDIQARSKLSLALFQEYHALLGLQLAVGTATALLNVAAGQKAALKLARLETMVLRDAFGRTSRKAAVWLAEYPAADADEEANRRDMLNELAAYPEPSAADDWIAAVVGLAVEVFTHRAAVQIVQDRFFDGHPILFQDDEAGLNGIVQTLEDAIAVFNEYMTAKAALDRATGENTGGAVASALPGEREGKPAINIDAIRASAASPAKIEADKWIRHARDNAKYHYLERRQANAFAWKEIREWLGARP
jgi:hypothetical protein